MSESYDISYSNKLDSGNANEKFDSSNENRSNENRSNENRSNEKRSKNNRSNDDNFNENRSNENRSNENRSNDDEFDEHRSNENRFNENSDSGDAMMESLSRREPRSNSKSRSSSSRSPKSPDMNVDIEQLGTSIFNTVWGTMLAAYSVMSSVVYAIFGPYIDRGLNSSWGKYAQSKVAAAKSWAGEHDSELRGVGYYLRRFAIRLARLSFAAVRLAFYTARNLGSQFMHFLQKRSGGKFGVISAVLFIVQWFGSGFLRARSKIWRFIFPSFGYSLLAQVVFTAYEYLRSKSGGTSGWCGLK